MPGSSPTFLDLAASLDRTLHRNIQWPLKTVNFAASPVTVTNLDRSTMADASGGNIVVNLPDATTNKGMFFEIKKTDPSNNTVTIQSSVGGQTIDGVGTKVLGTQNDVIDVISDGTNYKMVASTIATVAGGGAVFYTVASAYLTSGVTTLNPVNGTTINFTVAQDAMCFFAATGLFSGFSGLISTSLQIFVDGVALVDSAYFAVNGSGGDSTGPVTQEPCGSKFLTAGPHTVNLVAGQVNIALQGTVGNPLTLSVLYPGASLTTTGPTPKAATYVVDATPGVGDFTTIQSALNAVGGGGVGGGYVLVREGSYTENLVFPNVPVVLRGCGDNTKLNVVGATIAFSVSVDQEITIEDMQVVGDGVSAQTLLAIPATVTGTKKILLNRVNSYDSVLTIVSNSGATTPLIEISDSEVRGATAGWTSAGGGTLILRDLVGTFGNVTGATTGKLITKNAPLGATVVVANTSVVEGSNLQSASGTSTNALVTIVATLANTRGLMGVGSVKNTGGVNSIDVKETFTDAFGTSSTLTTTVTPGNFLPLDLGIQIGTGFAPYVSYKAEVIDTVGGSHSTYVSNFTSQGAV